MQIFVRVFPPKRTLGRKKTILSPQKIQIVKLTQAVYSGIFHLRMKKEIPYSYRE